MLEYFDDKHGYLTKFLNLEWRPLLQVIVRYITCDGRFSSVHFYRLRNLMVLKGFGLNLPCFFLNSLEKMAYVVQHIVGYQERILFHHGLLKIMLQYQFHMIGKSWD